jgi:hypothetical protein
MVDKRREKRCIDGVVSIGVCAYRKNEHEKEEWISERISVLSKSPTNTVKEVIEFGNI